MKRKKILSFILASLLAFSSAPITLASGSNEDNYVAATAETGRVLGDINNDGSVDIGDAIDLFMYSMLPDLYPIDYPGSIDLDKNGFIDIGDALSLFMYSMLPDQYPIDWGEAVVVTYTVTFVDYNGVELKTETVEKGKGATAPAAPTRKGYVFDGWDKAFDNITSDLTVTATYTPCDHSNMQTVEAKDASCYENGNVAYWFCAHCEKYFSDAEGTLEISFSETVIEARHTVVIDPAVEATCSQEGLTEGKHCSACNEVLVPQMEIGKKNHTPGEEATCTENQICTVCKEVLVTSNGHVPGVNATCTEPQRCTVCKSTLVEAEGHSLVYVEERDPVNANDPGNCAYWQCSVCNNCYLDEEATQEIALADTAWKTYLVYFHDLENDTYTVGTYKQSEVLSLKNVTPVEMQGYDFNGWHSSENFTKENKISRIPAGNTQKIDLYANRSLHEYKITLLGIGREEVWTYNIVNGIKLTTPKWKESAGQGDCLIFSHWSDEKGDEISEIPAGEFGDRTIEANWIYKENYAISNKNMYTYVNGVMDQYGRYSFIYEIGVIKDIVLSKQHSYTFDGLTEHTEKETKTYTVGASAGQQVAKTISKIVASSTEMENISNYTKTHTEGWEFGAKWRPEVEYAGVKASAWEASGGYSESDTDVYENTGFSSEKYYVENDTEDEVRATIDYYTEESVSRTVSETFIPGVTPIGNYIWARLMDVKVYAIVTYNPYTTNYVFDIYSVPTNVHDGFLYTLPSELEYSVNIVSGDVLDFEIPFEKIPEMFYTVEYNANGGTGEMHKSVHELGVSSNLLSKNYVITEGEEQKSYGYTKTGYTFTGWNTSPDGKGETYTDEFLITSNIAAAGETVMLYAQWKADSYTVIFNANDGTIGETSKTVVFDDNYGALPTPYRTGYTFNGWKYGDNFITPNTKVEVASNHTLVAQWIPNIYTVTYDANGGTGGAQEYATYGADYTIRDYSGFSRSGYACIGWSLSADAVTPDFKRGDVVEYVFDQGYTLYAVWSKTAYTWSSVGRTKGIESGEKYEEQINPSFDTKTLTEHSTYTKIKVTVVFDAKVVYSCYQRIIVYSKDTGKEFYAKDWDISEDGWQTGLSFSFTANISELQSGGSFWIRWECPNSNWRDKWELGTTSVTCVVE